MSAVKPPNAGKGRPPGAPNRTTAAVKDAILRAFDEVGGKSYLAQIAKKDHKTFCALLGRILPREPADQAGDKDDAPVAVIRDPDPHWTRRLAEMAAAKRL